MKMFQILEKINIGDYKGVKVSKISKSEDTEILHISIEKDAILKKHTSPKDALLMVLEGCIFFHLNNDIHCLKKHQIFNFAKDTEHWVEAQENSNFLIIR